MKITTKISGAELRKSFVCPYDHHKLLFQSIGGVGKKYECVECKREYPLINEVPNFLPDGLREWTSQQQFSSGNKAQSEKALGKWRPGFRGWSPSTFIRLLSFGKGEGRLRSRSKGIVLDVGCGDVAKGDVNTDVYFPSPLPVNFVLSTAERLPFKDNSYDVVRSGYVIEHNLYPTEMIKEHYRVCKKRVEIFTDNSDWLGVYAYRLLNVGSIFHDEHYFKWSIEYFRNILNRLNFKGKVQVFNTSPSILVKMISLFGKLPRIGVVFYRDLYVEIYKINKNSRRHGIRLR